MDNVDGLFLGLFLSSPSCLFTWYLTYLALSLGLVTSEKECAGHILSKRGGGNLLAIIIGGSQEALDARPGAYRLLLKNRKGFVRLALIHGYGTLGGSHSGAVGGLCFVGETAKMIVASIFGKEILRPYGENCKLVSRSQVSRCISIKETEGIDGQCFLV